MDIRKLKEADAAEWWRLRLESLETEPLAFGKSPQEHRATPVSVIAKRLRDAAETAVYLGAFEGDRMVGMATFLREAGLKEQHKGRIYGVYVSSPQRGKGLGRALVARVLEAAWRDPMLEQVLLAVSATQTAAIALYRSLGFETFGHEPRALKAGNAYVDEVHMILRRDMLAV